MDVWQRGEPLARPLGVRTVAEMGLASLDPFKVSPIGSACSEASPLLSDAFNAPRSDGVGATSSDYFSCDKNTSPSSSTVSPAGGAPLLYASPGAFFRRADGPPLSYGNAIAPFSPVASVGPFSPSLLVCSTTQPTILSSGSPSPQFGDLLFGAGEFGSNYFDGGFTGSGGESEFYGDNSLCTERFQDSSNCYLLPTKSEIDEGIDDPTPYSQSSRTSERKRRKSPHRVPRGSGAAGDSNLSHIKASDESMSYYDEVPLWDSSTGARKRGGYIDEFGLDDDDYCSRSATSSSVSSLSGSADGVNSKDREAIANDKLLPLMPVKTRSKMHDLAVKHQLITNQNTRGQGVIQLSAEEKRTLIQEGYRLPTRLPLTRNEEEALKIVRRKIKNKLSAQESRRKRKEYNDALEKKVRAFYNDNLQLRNRIKQLETLNRDLVAQLKKFQQPQI